MGIPLLVHLKFILRSYVGLNEAYMGILFWPLTAQSRGWRSFTSLEGKLYLFLSQQAQSSERYALAVMGRSGVGAE